MNMKVKYADVVKFLNGTPGILEKRIPSRLWMAIDMNVRAFSDAGASYMKKRETIINDINASEEEKTAAINELLRMEVDVNVQKVPDSVLDAIDTSDKFDALTGEQLGAIRFMF
jgi:hypothetical protein